MATGLRLRLRLKSMCAGCLQPPMSHPTLLAMIDASNRRLRGASIHAWRCSECANRNINLDNGQLDPQPPPPVYAVSTIRGDNQQQSIQGNQEQDKAKKAVSRRIHGWHEHVPSPRKALPAHPITGVTAAVWPPIRRKKKAEVHAQARQVENVSHDFPPKNLSGRGTVDVERRRRPDGRGQTSKPRPMSHATSPFPGSAVLAEPALPTDFSGLPYRRANHFNSPWFHTRKRTHNPSTSRQTIPPPNNDDAEPFRLPGPSTPCTSLKPPLIDLCKVLKRKRSTLQRSDSLTTKCSDFAEGDRLLSSGSGGPPAKRQRLGERDVTEKRVEGLKEVERPSTMMPRHSETVEDNSHAKERNKKPDNEALPMVDHTHQRSETRDVGVASQVPASRHVRSEHDGTAEHPRVRSLRPVSNQQGTIPAPYHQSRSYPVSSFSTTHLSPIRLSIPPARPASKVQSVPSVTPPTPRSLSPPGVFTGDTNDSTCVLEDIVARLQARCPNDGIKPKLGKTRIRMPRLARWFGKIEAKAQDGTCVRKRKKMMKPMMVGSDEEWTFVGAPMRAAG